METELRVYLARVEERAVDGPRSLFSSHGAEYVARKEPGLKQRIQGILTLIA